MSLYRKWMELIHPKTLHRAVLTPHTLRQESDGFHTLFPDSFPVPAAPELGINICKVGTTGINHLGPVTPTSLWRCEGSSLLLATQCRTSCPTSECQDHSSHSRKRLQQLSASCKSFLGSVTGQGSGTSWLLPEAPGSVSLDIADFAEDMSADKKICHRKVILLLLCLSEPKLNCGVWMGIQF